MDRTYEILVDVETRRPMCVLIQAANGFDSRPVSEFFDARHWLLAPTDNMAAVTGTKEQWLGHAKRLEERNGKRS